MPPAPSPTVAMAPSSPTGKTATEAVAASGGISLTDAAYARLEELVVTLELAPGEALSEQALAARLELGRTPIREALQRLAREGLIEIIARKGVRVTPVDPSSQLLVLEVRRELERLLCRCAAERADAAERAALRSLAEGMDTAGSGNDDLAFMRLDRDLNRLLIGAAHNDYAAGAMRLLAGLSRRFWYRHYRSAADLPLCAALHGEQARAVASGNIAEAAASSDRLMDYVESFTRVAAADGGGDPFQPKGDAP